MSWHTIFTFLAAVGPVLLLVPVGLFTLEVALAVIFPRQRQRPLVNKPPSTVILIPAHNEEAGIGEMLQKLQSTLRGGERIIVVADNCTDRTAEVATQCGVEVLQRTSETERGKGYALAHGIAHIQNRKRAPEVLVILDADCEVSPDGVARLAYEAQRRGAPVQGLYLCYATDPEQTRSALSAMAFQFKNHIRPLGVACLHGPSYLTGSGMALPWKLIDRVCWASGNLVEDMQLGIDYALEGHAPAFFDGAQIVSPLPTDGLAATTQRTRWEHGHLKTMLDQGVRLVGQSLRQGRPALLLLALDLAIPPLALLALLWCISFGVSAVIGLGTGIVWPVVLSAIEGSLFASAVFAGWLMFCRQTVPVKMLLSIPGYMYGKLGIYTKFLRGAEQRWVRTQRVGEKSV